MINVLFWTIFDRFSTDYGRVCPFPADFGRKFSEPKKIEFSKNFNFFFFWGSDAQPLSGFSTSIKTIDTKILPASIYSMSSYIRKCIQIEIWTHGVHFIFRFSSLTLSICRRPHFFNFSWHRITLRVWMWTSCSTSHCKYK